MILPATACEIIDTWTVGGLRGTGSHDVVISDVFVPTDYGSGFTDPHVLPEYRYRIPPFSRVIPGLGAMALGLARTAIETFSEIAGAKTPQRTTQMLRDNPAAQVRASQAESLVRSARLFLFDSVDRLWRRLIATGGFHGFKLHPPLQQFHPNDKAAYPFYEVIAEAKLPVIFHTGHSGIGTGMPGGGGVRLKYGNPMDIDDVAVDFPDMPIIMAHPSFPWQDEAISVCLHKPQVYIDLSGWSPKYFSPILIQYANTLLKKKMLFGSDYPLITPDRWMTDFAAIAIRDEVRPLILKENAAKLFSLT